MRQSEILEAAAALSTVMDVDRGALAVSTESIRTRIADMQGVFSDDAARGALEGDGNPTVFEVYRTEPSEQGVDGLCYASTVVLSGRVGDEFYMTRGHSHNDAPEIYLTVRGEGMMLLQTPEHQVQALSMARGTVLYVPGSTAHRLVNTGSEPLVTFAVYPPAAGRDYRPVDSHGFKRIVVATDDGPDLVLNPRFGGDGVGEGT